VTTASITPSGVPNREGRPPIGTGRPQVLIRYHQAEVKRYSVRIAQPAPLELQISMELGQEENGVWAHIPELDVSAEGADALEAFRNVLAATRDWLGYVRDEHPELAPELARQERYVPLLDAPVFSWFKSFKFAD
jgi:hypothetical protein